MKKSKLLSLICGAGCLTSVPVVITSCTKNDDDVKQVVVSGASYTDVAVGHRIYETFLAYVLPATCAQEVNWSINITDSSSKDIAPYLSINKVGILEISPTIPQKLANRSFKINIVATSKNGKVSSSKEFIINTQDKTKIVGNTHLITATGTSTSCGSFTTNADLPGTWEVINDTTKSRSFSFKTWFELVASEDTTTVFVKPKDTLSPSMDLTTFDLELKFTPDDKQYERDFEDPIMFRLDVVDPSTMNITPDSGVYQLKPNEKCSFTVSNYGHAEDPGLILSSIDFYLAKLTRQEYEGEAGNFEYTVGDYVELERDNSTTYTNAVGREKDNSPFQVFITLKPDKLEPGDYFIRMKYKDPEKYAKQEADYYANFITIVE